MELSSRLRSLFIGISPTWMPLKSVWKSCKMSDSILCMRASLHYGLPCFPSCCLRNADCDSSPIIVTTQNTSSQPSSFQNSLSFTENHMEQCIITHEKYMKCRFRCPKIKFYWNTVMCICLHMAPCALQYPDLSNCDGGCLWLSTSCCYLGHYELEQVVTVTALQHYKCLVYCCTTAFDFLLYYSVRKEEEVWVSDVLLRRSGVWIIFSNLTWEHHVYYAVTP